MKRSYLRLISLLTTFLGQPHRVLFYGLLLAIVSLSLDGSLLSFWRLSKGKEEVHSQINQFIQKNRLIEAKIGQASQPEFLRKLAIEQSELAQQDELIFVFTEDEDQPSEE